MQIKDDVHIASLHFMLKPRVPNPTYDVTRGAPAGIRTLNRDFEFQIALSVAGDEPNW